jgi:hypothetical protein
LYPGEGKGSEKKDNKVVNNKKDNKTQAGTLADMILSLDCEYQFSGLWGSNPFSFAKFSKALFLLSLFQSMKRCKSSNVRKE